MDCSEIANTIEKLRQLTQLDVQTNWRYCEADLSVSQVWASNWPTWPKSQVNEKGHISWKAGRQVLWLIQQLAVPQDLQGYSLQGLALRLGISWWAEEAEIFVNGKLVQQGDLFDFSVRALLSSSVKIGDEFIVAVRLVSPGHDRGALTRSLCLYETIESDRFEPGFIADELAVLQEYFSTFDPSKLDNLATSLAEIDWSALASRETFERSLLSVRQTLQSQIPRLSSKIFLLGHAHLDLAWLWPVEETWEAAQRTFESVLHLQKDFPNLIFCHSSPALYAWIEENRPDLFASIKQQVESGRWEIVGGMWVEPDLNLIDGESIVRQILYGQRYTLQKFGQLMPVVWVPDTFGFCWQLPQFLKQGGAEYFVTQKLRWNDTTKFPYGVFWWQAPDGSRIFSYMSALIGESIEPVKMIKYVCEWEKQTNLKDALWLPGVGDRGGGPTRDMLEIGQRWEKSPFFPRLEFSTAVDYLRSVELNQRTAEGGEGRIPVWNDELYLEFHRGCYTTHAEQKRYNRRCEELLYRAELFASLATLTAGVPYPKAELENAWKKVLFNQFHDILPGSSIPQVFVDANRDWMEVERVGREIVEGATSAIASRISLPQPPHPDAVPIVVFNALNWQRSQVVSVSLPSSATSWAVCDLDANPLPCQFPGNQTLLFLAADIPSVGYRLFWLCPQKAEMRDSDSFQEEGGEKSAREGQHNINLSQDPASVNKVSLPEKDWVVENEFLRVRIEGETGNLASVVDKINKREILEGSGGNLLQAFEDSGQYWDAWNIDPNYEKHPLPVGKLKKIEGERGEVRSLVRVVREIGESEFCQEYILETRSPILKIVTTVNWQERHVVVKAAFPLNLEADFATYEIACGAIKRTTKPQTPQEKAKWEVPALRWADLSTNEWGVSLLNDSKYGYDAQPSQLRLTLLRSPSWPDAEADKGCHEFTYALYPHSGSWQEADTVRQARELNSPLQVVMGTRGGEEGFVTSLPPVCQFIDLSGDNLILMAFKQSEDNPNEWILRCYECHGKEAELNLKSERGLEIARPVDLLERAIASPIDDKTVQIAPWKIASFALTVAANK